jgi:nucleotide-binding universal stress UspA family protein
MLAIHTILHPTDFSAYSQSAFQLACALARDYGARVVVLHVAAPPPLMYGEGSLPPDPDLFLQEGQEQLRQLVVPDASVAVERRFEEGEIAATILRVADDLQADLIAMGTHGRTGLRRLLMGSVAESVVRRAHCPVLTLTPSGRSLASSETEVMLSGSGAR